MIRLLSCFVLIVSSAIVLAQPLYKWVESDGSITFSLTPPASGIEFETVTAPVVEPTITPKAPQAPQIEDAPSSAKTDKKPTLEKALPPTSESSTPVQRLAPEQAVQDVPQRSSQGEQTNQRGLSNQYPENGASRVIPSSEKTIKGTNQNPAESIVGRTAKTRKQRQCEDLQKRVLSLERRLKTRLTPEDMDNTVIHMARYQRSYDKHCEQ